MFIQYYATLFLGQYTKKFKNNGKKREHAMYSQLILYASVFSHTPQRQDLPDRESKTEQLFARVSWSPLMSKLMGVSFISHCGQAMLDTS